MLMLLLALNALFVRTARGGSQLAGSVMLRTDDVDVATLSSKQTP